MWNTSHYSQSPKETEDLGRKIALELKANDILCINGDLGAGKTALMKGIANQITGCSPREVSSPTFTYLNIYEGPLDIYHFDLYRLNDEQAFFALGFEEYLNYGGICCIEWPTLIEKHLPNTVYQITICHEGVDGRVFHLKRGSCDI